MKLRQAALVMALAAAAVVPVAAQVVIQRFDKVVLPADQTVNELQVGTVAGSKYPTYNIDAAKVFIGGAWSPTVFDSNFVRVDDVFRDADAVQHDHRRGGELRGRRRPEGEL